MNFCDTLLSLLYLKFTRYAFNPYLENFGVPNKKLGDSLGYLVRKGYLKREKQRGIYSLTLKGKKKAENILRLKKAADKKWDGKWRLAIFDVPEKKRSFRSQVRKILGNLNFVRLQRSVWITPYDVFGDLIDLLPSAKKGDWIKLLIVEKISDEDKLKKEFGLA